jgi:hypothetical protein
VDREVIAYINSNFVAVHADLAHNHELAARLGVFKAGTTLLFNKAGKPIATLYGRTTAEHFLSDLKKHS